MPKSYEELLKEARNSEKVEFSSMRDHNDDLIEFSQPQKLEIINALKENKNLKSLQVFDQTFSANDGRTFTEALKGKAHLHNFTIFNCDIANVKPNFFTELLEDKVSLHSLRLMPKPYLTEDQLINIADSLKNNKGLRSLELSGDMQDKGMQALVKIVKKNEIQNLLLSNQYDKQKQITDDGAKALADALKDNKQLQVLDVSHNKIGDIGAKALADALKDKNHLQVLRLNHNQIGDIGSKAFINALRGKELIRDIYLAQNMISEDNKRDLAQFANKNNITDLSISYGQGISVETWNELKELVKTNPNLNQYSSPWAPKEISDILTKNRNNAEKLASAIYGNNKEYFNSIEGKKILGLNLTNNELAGLKGREKAVASCLAKKLGGNEPMKANNLFAEIYSALTKKVREYDKDFLKNSGVVKETDHPVFGNHNLRKEIGKHIHPTKNIVGKHTSRLKQENQDPSKDKGRNQ
jgi:hypothetical protein